MSEHTPGPWAFDPTTGRVEGPPHKHPQSRELGVNMQSKPIVAFVRGYHGQDEANANGYLLAAAPELLAALEAIDYVVECRAMCINRRPDDKFAMAYRKVRAAIAKAKGD